jgi:hypothetical protein
VVRDARPCITRLPVPNQRPRPGIRRSGREHRPAGRTPGGDRQFGTPARVGRGRRSACSDQDSGAPAMIINSERPPARGAVPGPQPGIKIRNPAEPAGTAASATHPTVIIGPGRPAGRGADAGPHAVIKTRHLGGDHRPGTHGRAGRGRRPPDPRSTPGTAAVITGSGRPPTWGTVTGPQPLIKTRNPAEPAGTAASATDPGGDHRSGTSSRAGHGRRSPRGDQDSAPPAVIVSPARPTVWGAAAGPDR